MVPPFPVDNTFVTSTARQSRYHEGRSLRISATYMKKKTYIDQSILLQIWAKKRIFSVESKNELTLVGSSPTSPHARAATPLQPWEIATIPIESGPGYTGKKDISSSQQVKLAQAFGAKITIHQTRSFNKVSSFS